MRSLVIAAALGASALALSASAQTPRQSTPDNPSSAASTPSMSESASSQAQSTTSSSASTSASSDKPVCKSVTTRGTLIPKRECHTQAQWDEMRTNAQQSLSNSNSNPGGPH
jgi:cytoskeletal protein RodZ